LDVPDLSGEKKPPLWAGVVKNYSPTGFYKALLEWCEQKKSPPKRAFI
jgi:hypothetical protein